MNRLAVRWVRVSICLVFILAGGWSDRTIVANQIGKVVVIVLDDSGSMKKGMGGDSRSRMTVAKQAMQRLIESLPAETQLGIILLNGAKYNGGWIVPLGELDKASAISTVSGLRADGGTPLGSVTYRAMEQLLKRRQQQPYGDYRMVVITDGEATDAPLLQANLPKLVSQGVILDVIGVDMQEDHSLVQRAHSYRRANDAASFEKALQEIFAESSFDSIAGNQGFELIAALPDELAEQALVALRECSQTSLDPEASLDNDISSGMAGSLANSAVPQPPPMNYNSRPAPAKTSITGKIFLAVVVMLIIVLFKSLAGISKRR